MDIGILKESARQERRVAITPNVISKIRKLGHNVFVEKGLGLDANFFDSEYVKAGAVISDTSNIWSCDIILKINKPHEDEAGKLSKNQTLISFFSPSTHPDLLKKCAKDNINVLSMDSVPRISRAQKMDALSSMANIAGSRAVIEAAHAFGRFFGGQITAAGKIPPAKVLIIGAGVAGLSAIGTASSLGAIVRAFDTRPEVKEQVESLGGQFLTVSLDEDGSSTDGYAKVMSKEFIDAEMSLFKEQCKDVDIIITTALIPGKEAPKLITKEMVDLMKPGSVIVDLASQQGGNCELCNRDEITEYNGVKIIGYTDLPSRLASQSSELYANNLYHILDELTPDNDGVININMEDDVIRGMTVIKNGEITYPPPKIKVSATPKAQEHKIEKLKPVISSRIHCNIFIILSRSICTRIFHESFYCICFIMLYWLYGHMECNCFVTYAVDVCYKCCQQHNNYWCSYADIISKYTFIDSFRVCSLYCKYKYFWRFCCNQKNIRDV